MICHRFSLADIVSLTTEALVDGAFTPVMMYRFDDLSDAAPSAEDLSLPAPFTHSKCGWQMGGFPYVHLMHHFLRA